MFNGDNLQLFEEVKNIKSKLIEAEQKFNFDQKEYNEYKIKNDMELMNNDLLIDEINSRKINVKEVLSEEKLSLLYILTILVSNIVSLGLIISEKSLLQGMNFTSLYYFNFGYGLFVLTGVAGLSIMGRNVYKNVKDRINKKNNDLSAALKQKNILLDRKDAKLHDLAKGVDVSYKEYINLYNQYNRMLTMMVANKNGNVDSFEKTYDSPKVITLSKRKVLK